MKFNITKKWLQKGTTEEDRLAVSAGTLSLYSMTKDKQRIPVVAEEDVVYAPANKFLHRLSEIKRHQNFISRRESTSFANELIQLLDYLRVKVKLNKKALALILEFYRADVIIERCDDSDGVIGDVFRENALDTLVSLAVKCNDKKWVADLILKIYEKNTYGLRDTVYERMTEYLPEEEIRSLVERLFILKNKTKDRYKENHWSFAIESIAKQLKDPAMLEKVKIRKGEDLSIASIIEISKLRHLVGDNQTALEWLQKIPVHEKYMVNDKDNLTLSIHLKMNNTKKAIEVAQKIFHRQRDVEGFERLVQLLGEDNRKKLLAEESSMILSSDKLNYDDLTFLLEAGCVDLAETYLLKFEQELDGNRYDRLLYLAKIFHKENRYLAESLIFRALIGALLGRAVSKYYYHAVEYLHKLDALESKISDWSTFDSHQQYKITLKNQHRLKKSFWEQYE